MEKEWKNGGVSGVEESTECRGDRTCLLRQFIAIRWTGIRYSIGRYQPSQFSDQAMVDAYEEI